MPYTAKQKRLFQAAAHDPEITKRKKLTRSQASKLYHEAKRHPVRKTILR